MFLITAVVLIELISFFLRKSFLKFKDRLLFKDINLFYSLGLLFLGVLFSKIKSPLLFDWTFLQFEISQLLLLYGMLIFIVTLIEDQFTLSTGLFIRIVSLFVMTSSDILINMTSLFSIITYSVIYLDREKRLTRFVLGGMGILVWLLVPNIELIEGFPILCLSYFLLMNMVFMYTATKHASPQSIQVFFIPMIIIHYNILNYINITSSNVLLVILFIGGMILLIKNHIQSNQRIGLSYIYRDLCFIIMLLSLLAGPHMRVPILFELFMLLLFFRDNIKGYCSSRCIRVFFLNVILLLPFMIVPSMLFYRALGTLVNSNGVFINLISLIWNIAICSKILIEIYPNTKDLFKYGKELKYLFISSIVSVLVFIVPSSFSEYDMYGISYSYTLITRGINNNIILCLGALIGIMTGQVICLHPRWMGVFSKIYYKGLSFLSVLKTDQDKVGKLFINDKKKANNSWDIMVLADFFFIGMINRFKILGLMFMILILASVLIYIKNV